jgi:predicted RNase H-like nuclease
VVLDEKGFSSAHLFSDIAACLEEFKNGKCIAIDMPIGMVDRGAREADLACKRYLSKRSSSLFPIPPRAAVFCEDYPQALAKSRELMGKGISRQAFMLFAKVREVDAHASDERIIEVHPETTFQVLNQNTPLGHSKKVWGGIQERQRILARCGVVFPGRLGAADGLPADDVLDAAAAAVSARRHEKGEAMRFPAKPVQQDASGRDIAIWA